MSSNNDERIGHAWAAVLQELIAKGEVSKDVLHDSDALIRWWRSLDPEKQNMLIGRVEEVSQGQEVIVPGNEKQEYQRKTKVKKWYPKPIYIVLGVILIVFCFVPLKEVAYTATEPLSYESEGFVHKEQRPAPDPRSVHATVEFLKDPDDIAQAMRDMSDPPECPVAYVTVQNTDTISGAFAVLIGFNTAEDYYSNYTGDITDITLQLRPGELELVKFYAADINADYDEWSWMYEVIPQTKTLTNYKKVTLFDYLQHY